MKDIEKEHPSYPVYGRSGMGIHNGKESAWNEEIRITPFVKQADGSFKGQLIYALVDLKDPDNQVQKGEKTAKGKIEIFELRDVVFVPQIKGKEE